MDVNRRRGRPTKPGALTPAERQARIRQRRAAALAALVAIATQARSIREARAIAARALARHEAPPPRA